MLRGVMKYPRRPREQQRGPEDHDGERERDHHHDQRPLKVFSSLSPPSRPVLPYGAVTGEHRVEQDEPKDARYIEEDERHRKKREDQGNANHDPLGDAERPRHMPRYSAEEVRRSTATASMIGGEICGDVESAAAQLSRQECYHCHPPVKTPAKRLEQQCGGALDCRSERVNWRERG